MNNPARWSPFGDLKAMQRDLNRVFENFAPVSVTGAGAWTPSLDLLESDEEIVVNMDVPGLTRENIEITLEGNLLSVHGTRQFLEETGLTYHRVERTFGEFNRAISLPTHVQAEGITAQIADGVLRITIPKKEQAKPKRIEISERTAQLTE